MSDQELFSDGEEEQPSSPEIPLQRQPLDHEILAYDSPYDSESESDDDIVTPHQQRPTAGDSRRQSSAVLKEKTNTSTPRRDGQFQKSLKPADKQKENEFSGITESLRGTNQLLLRMSRRMEKLEEKMRHIEEKIDNQSASSASSSSTPARTRKRDIPLEVRRETRRVYAMLLEEDDENFQGWSIGEGLTYKSPENQRVVSRLVDEVRGLNPNFLTQHIRDASYRFYRTRCEEKSVTRRGLAAEKQKRKRMRERITRKLGERSAALQKLTFKRKSDMDLWRKVLRADVMSSEESDLDGEEDVLRVHSLSWRSEAVTRMFRTLDSEASKLRTPQSRRQMKRRVLGTLSSRQRPAAGSVPSWALCN